MQQHLYEHFWSSNHNYFISDVSVTFIDKTDPSFPLTHDTNIMIHDIISRCIANCYYCIKLPIKLFPWKFLRNRKYCHPFVKFERNVDCFYFCFDILYTVVCRIVYAQFGHFTIKIFTYYLTGKRPTSGHCRGNNHTNPMLITAMICALLTSTNKWDNVFKKDQIEFIL